MKEILKVNNLIKKFPKAGGEIDDADAISVLKGINFGILICRTALIICSASSKNSPVPALPPISFGTCIIIIVVQIPVINPPITGSDI